MKAKGAGDVWTWVALDPDSKLVPCWFVGQRHVGCAYHFLADLKDCLAHRVQLTTKAARLQINSGKPECDTSDFLDIGHTEYFRK